MQNAWNAERSKGTEQVKITEWWTEQMKIMMNPHGTMYTQNGHNKTRNKLRIWWNKCGMGLQSYMYMVIAN